MNWSVPRYETKQLSVAELEEAQEVADGLDLDGQSLAAEYLRCLAHEVMQIRLASNPPRQNP